MLRACLGVVLLFLSATTFAKIVYINSTVEIGEEHVGLNSYIPVGTELTLNAEVNVGNSTPKDFLHNPDGVLAKDWASKGTLRWESSISGHDSGRETFNLDMISSPVYRYNGNENPEFAVDFAFQHRSDSMFDPYIIPIVIVRVELDANILDEPQWSTPFSELVEGRGVSSWFLMGYPHPSKEQDFPPNPNGNNIHTLIPSLSSPLSLGQDSLYVVSEVARIEDAGNDGSFDIVHAPITTDHESNGIRIGSINDNSNSVGILRFDTTGLDLDRLESALLRIPTDRTGSESEAQRYRIVAFVDEAPIELNDATQLGTTVAEVEIGESVIDVEHVSLDASVLASFIGNTVKLRLEFVSGNDSIYFDFSPGGEPRLDLRERLGEDVIINNGDSETSSSGDWDLSRLPESYDGNSLWATVGSDVDSYRFTPNLQGGDYEVFAWNSCYRNRATNVPHRIVHAEGETIVEVDQDCDTGTHGEWYSLGVYRFHSGASGYLEISDQGVDSSSTTYIGADAARFVYRAAIPLINTPPNLRVNFNNAWVDDALMDQEVQRIRLGQSIDTSAEVLDSEDGDISENVSWALWRYYSVDPYNLGPMVASGQGSTFSAIPPEVGMFVLDVEARDSLNASDKIFSTAMLVIVEEPDGASDDDNDGLTLDEELVAGTDPNNPDSDNDGLIDGVEVNTHNTDPNSADSDNDQINDALELELGLNPLVGTDAHGDLDNDGISNLQEILDGTDPLTPEPEAEPQSEIVLDNGDIGTSTAGSWREAALPESHNGTSVWSTVGGSVDRYRFTPTFDARAHYEVFAWNSCYGNRATNVRHIVSNANGLVTVEVDQDCDTGTHGEWYSLGIYEFVAGAIGYVEITDEGLTPSSTTYMGADAVRFSLRDTNNAPVITHNLSDETYVVNTEIQLSATALDVEDGELTQNIQWSDSISSATAIGGNFTFTPDVGVHVITAQVTDSDNETASINVTITVVASNSDLDDDNDGLSNENEHWLGTDPNNPDTDGDGINDGDEFNRYRSNPFRVDTDWDLIPDLYEVENGLDLMDPTDFINDPDNDGIFNIDEYRNGSDPQVADLPPVTDFIINNGDVGTSTSGNWRLAGLPDSYEGNSLWAVAGGAVDSYFFTPTIEKAGNYEVFAWNSCYNNRAVNVRHVIDHANGETIVEVDQDCDTGSHGEWFSLGVYPFNVGSNGRLEITDAGLTPSSTTYLGADAARFVFQPDPNDDIEIYNVDQSQSLDLAAYEYIHNKDSIGQTFIPQNDEMNFVELVLVDRHIEFYVNTEVYVNIREGSSEGNIIGTSVQRNLIDCFNLAEGPGCEISGGGGQRIRFMFSSSLSLTPEQAYFLEIVVLDDRHLVVGTDDEDSYSNGSMFIDGVDQGRDIWFLQGITNLQQLYADQDGDGFGNFDQMIESVGSVSGYVTDATDCDDNDADNFPGNYEYIGGVDPGVDNGVDNNCDGLSY